MHAALRFCLTQGASPEVGGSFLVVSRGGTARMRAGGTGVYASNGHSVAPGSRARAIRHIIFQHRRVKFEWVAPEQFDASIAGNPIMSFLIILIVFVVCVVVIGTTASIMSARKKTTGISKDYAEQAVLRRLKNGRTIGARFTKAERGYAWEFDVADSGRLYRVWVDGRTGVLFKAIDLQRANIGSGNSSNMLGKTIG